MPDQKTHREVKAPQISIRFLADYMHASELAARTITRNCKFQPIARVVQHDEAKAATSKLIRDGKEGLESFKVKAQQLRDRLTDDVFERSVCDVNADYIERVAKVFTPPPVGDAELLPPGRTLSIEIDGVKVSVEMAFRTRRLTRTNKVRVGAGTLRYSKGKALAEEVGAWQSAFLYGFLGLVPPEENADPEQRLCLTYDAYGGQWLPAPTDSVRRFRNMEAACASIAERWPNIQPPAGAIL